MTPKQRVLSKYPNAYSAQSVDDCWAIWCPGIRGQLSDPAEKAKTAQYAWYLAAERTENWVCLPDAP